jgi:hypothetical protein
MTHLSKEQTRFTEHDRQTLQDLFDITLRYYQNSVEKNTIQKEKIEQH